MEHQLTKFKGNKMKTYTKMDLTNLFMDDLCMNKSVAQQVTEDIVSTVTAAIFERKWVYIPKLMRIISTVKGERPGRNPKTGEYALISTRHSIRASTSSNSNKTSCEHGKFTKTTFTEDMMDIGYSLNSAIEVRDIFYKFLSQIADGSSRVEIRGLGVFSTFTKSEGRVKRNPKTGESITKGLSYTPSFKCSSSLRITMDKAYL
jgi:integration host factor subunit alpha